MNPRLTHFDRSTHAAAPRGAFTLLELVLVMGIILLIASFLLSALGRSTRSARQTASQRTAEALAASVEQFRLQFGFLPPLVHDGPIVSNGSNRYMPYDRFKNTNLDGPIVNRNGDIPSVPYDFSTIVVWPVGDEIDFFRRRDGGASDAVDLPGGGAWNIDTAWDDRRYSRFALAYYLTGSLPRSIDGVPGEGMSRPLDTGWFTGVGYPVGSTRDRYPPSVDTDRHGLRVKSGYARPIEIAEHGVVSYDPDNPPTAQDVYDLYPAAASNFLTALVDDHGIAYRYYRWEHGRFDGTRMVNETSLDLNIPPILLDPEALIEVMNDDAIAADYDLTDGNLDLRNARFAIVGAGSNRLFGTEPVEYLLEFLNEPDPEGDAFKIARLRKLAMSDNVIAFGK